MKTYQKDTYLAYHICDFMGIMAQGDTKVDILKNQITIESDIK